MPAKSVKNSANLLRKQPRILLNSPAWVRQSSKDQWQAVLIMDVSKTGMRIQGLPQSSSKSYVLQWPLIPGTRHLECKLQMVRNSGAGLSGLRFEKPSAKLLKIIEALVRFHRY